MHDAQNGGHAMALPETSEPMPRSMGGTASEMPLAIPAEKMPLVVSGGCAMESPLSVDSPLPGRS